LSYGGRWPSKCECSADGCKELFDNLIGKKWDAVIDTSGYFPRMVKASATLLAPNVKQYVFSSTRSVYKSASVPNADETGPLATLVGPATEDMRKDFADYGDGKALCEKAAEAAIDTLDVSANLIVSDVPQPALTPARLCARRRGGPRVPAGIWNWSLTGTGAVAQPERIRRLC
jgi:hypothetical protein